jgi:glutaredoxin
MKVEIYSKPDCPLCEDAKEIVRNVRQRIPFELTLVDITQDPALFARYRYDIPVVFVDGHKAFKHRLTEEELQRRLSRS